MDIINRAGFDFSHLVPSEDVFKAVTEQSLPATELVRDERKIDADALRAVMTAVRERVDEIAAMAPRIIGSPMEQYLDELDAAIDAWPR